MVTPNPTPTDSRLSNAEEGKGTPSQPAAQRPTDTPSETQSQLAGSDGAGIRGDYGDADQTNGLEGGSEQPADAGPDRATDNPTNAPQGA